MKVEAEQEKRQREWQRAQNKAIHSSEAYRVCRQASEEKEKKHGQSGTVKRTVNKVNHTSKRELIKIQFHLHEEMPTICPVSAVNEMSL